MGNWASITVRTPARARASGRWETLGSCRTARAWEAWVTNGVVSAHDVCKDFGLTQLRN